jgi:hypothetical protein
VPSEPELPPAVGDPLLTHVPVPSNQRTAARAKALLCGSSPAFRDPSGVERSTLAAAFAAKNFVVYGKAFDLVEVSGPELSLSDPAMIRDAIDQRFIALVEVKSTSADRDEEFRGHFFSMSTAELLVAQSLGRLFKFAFVNTTTEHFRLVTLQDVYRRAKAIYPAWSIRFDDEAF